MKKNRITRYGYRFNETHFNTNQAEPSATGCIEWTGAKHCQGYGFISVMDAQQGKKKMMTVHRLVAMIHEDRRIPSSEMVLHTCSNPGCVNPQHLKIGDKADMTDIMRQHGSLNGQKRTWGGKKKK